MHESANADTANSRSVAKELIPNHMVRSPQTFVLLNLDNPPVDS
jgi:hypothetical protein